MASITHARTRQSDKPPSVDRAIAVIADYGHHMPESTETQKAHKAEIEQIANLLKDIKQIDDALLSTRWDKISGSQNKDLFLSIDFNKDDNAPYIDIVLPKTLNDGMQFLYNDFTNHLLSPITAATAVKHLTDAVEHLKEVLAAARLETALQPSDADNMRSITSEEITRTDSSELMQRLEAAVLRLAPEQR